MFRQILLAVALVSAATPAFADNHRNRGGNDRHDNRGGDRHDNRGGNWNRGNDWNRGNNDWNRNWNNRSYDRHRSTANLGIGIILGSALYAGSRGYGYDDYRYSTPAYSNSWGLYPGSCRWDREFAYWRGRPAEVEVQRCADGYGRAYIVAGAQRLWRYR